MAKKAKKKALKRKVVAKKAVGRKAALVAAKKSGTHVLQDPKTKKRRLASPSNLSNISPKTLADALLKPIDEAKHDRIVKKAQRQQKKKVAKKGRKK